MGEDVAEYNGAYKVSQAMWPSAYLLICIGAGAGGGGGGLEAQETRPPAMTDAARARRAYFIVWCSWCLLLLS